MATAYGYSAAPCVSKGRVQTPIDRVSVNAATPPMTDSQLLPAPPPAAMLPPPPPARDLHGARARITLEKVKLEIESVREVLGDVNGLGEAVKGLQSQVELLLVERAARDEALEARVKVAVQTACQEQSSKIKADLEAVSRHLSSAWVDPNKSRNSYNLRTADNLEATLRKDVEERFAQFETLLEKRLESGAADGRHSAEIGELRKDIESLSRTVARQAEVVRRLQGEVIGLGKQLEEKASGELKQPSGRANNSANPPLGVQVTPTPALASVHAAAGLTISAERRTVGAPAVDDKSTTASSPSLPRPSPPRRKVPLRQLANSITRPGAGTSPLQAAKDGQATCAGSPGSAPERSAHVGPFGLARPRETSTTTTTRMRIFSLERQTPSRRRLLEPSEASTSSIGSSRTKTTSGPSPTLIVEEERRSIMQQQQQAAKRRRTIKQDESQGSSLVQQGEEEGYDLIGDATMNEQGDAGQASRRGLAGAAAEEEHGSSSEGEPSTQE